VCIISTARGVQPKPEPAPAAEMSADEKKEEKAFDTPFTLALIAGGCAGTTVDVALYPLDTLKTRLQAEGGFWKAGGFNGIYRGVLATALGASPGSALFFSAYEGMKPVLRKLNGDKESWVQQSFAASCGEVAACLCRVPTAVVTQNMQIGKYASFGEAVSKLYAEKGVSTFFVGYWTTVMREIPFSFIQFPMCALRGRTVSVHVHGVASGTPERPYEVQRRMHANSSPSTRHSLTRASNCPSVARVPHLSSFALLTMTQVGGDEEVYCVHAGQRDHSHTRSDVRLDCGCHLRRLHAPVRRHQDAQDAWDEDSRWSALL
jgi:hypothetical protein